MDQPRILELKVRNESVIPAQIRRLLAPALLISVDYLSIVCASLVTILLRNTVWPVFFPDAQMVNIHPNFLYFYIPVMYFLFLHYSGMYTKRLPFWQNAEYLFRTCCYVMVSTITILYIVGVSGEISRFFVIVSGIFAFLFIIIARYTAKNFLVVAGLWQKPVLVIGAGKTAELLAEIFEKEPTLGYEIMGVVDDHSNERALVKKYPCLGNFANVERAVYASGVDDVIIAVPGLARQALLDLIYRVQPLVRNLLVVPDLFGVPLSNLQIDQYFQAKTVLLRSSNNMLMLRNRIMKKTLDIIGSLLGIVILSPVFLGIAIAIKRSSPGPVFFSHKRIGEEGQAFPCYKFRTMIPNAQQVLQEYLDANPEAKKEWEQDFKLKDDPRITKIGSFLRRTSLDELPQLFNVLKGEMSLVGPRPITKEEIAKYHANINDYYLVSPGITGYWQINGRNDVDYDTRVELDSWYVRNWSLWLDIVLLLKTIKIVLSRKGAY